MTDDIAAVAGGANNNNNDNNNPTTSVSFYDRLVGYIVFNGCYLTAAILTFGPPFLSILFPQSVALLWSIPLAYHTYTLTVGRYEIGDGHPRPTYCQHSAIIRCMRNVTQLTILPLPIELRKVESLSTSQFVIAQFPHGAWADYHLPMVGMWHGPDAFPHLHTNIRCLAASVLFRTPLVRELALWTNGIDANKAIAQAAIQRGRTLLVRPGGLAEQLRTTRGRDLVYLSNRTGFIRLAMTNDVPIVPSFVFGASDAHYTPTDQQFLFNIREWIQKKVGLCLPIAIGYLGSMCPLPTVRTTVVFGKPIYPVMKNKGRPTQEEIITTHAIFCTALMDLYDTHKVALGYGDRQLEII